MIDFETTGAIGTKARNEVVTLGALHADRAMVLQRRTSSKPLFYTRLVDLISVLPRPFYAYNALFERNVMSTELGLTLASDEIVDIMEPWRNRAETAGMKWPRLDDLVSEPWKYFGDPQFTGVDVPTLWKAFAVTGNEELLGLIAAHCLSDVFRETMLLLLYGDGVCRP